MEYIVVIFYCIALLFIFLFSLGQLHLTWHYLKAKKDKPKVDYITEANDLPLVTVQLPVYNERYVVQRLIEAVVQIDYPLDKLEIQILDDSSDETTDIIAQAITPWVNKGIDIQHVRRESRNGYKAGALQYGMGIARGEFMAIFDADFIPSKDFIKKTIGHFHDEKVGMVQSKWGHINKDYSALTKLQAFGLDAHFSIEQAGRSHAHSFINFNGTAGVWRKETIIDAGGWSADTLTEDLDLSYRAQLKGWKFEYMEELESPAELPIIMSAVKSQQYRWNKGAAETARKNLSNVFFSNMSWSSKVHAFFHLFNSSVFVALLLASVLSIPMLFIKNNNPSIEFLFDLGSVFLIGFFSITLFYWVATKNTISKNKLSYFLKIYPTFLTVSMGLSLHNAIAVLEGLVGRKTPFVRTPKFNVSTKKDSWKGNIYVKRNLTLLTFIEFALCLYFVFGIGAGIYLHDWGLIVFHIMLATGFGIVFIYSVTSGANAQVK